MAKLTKRLRIRGIYPPPFAFFNTLSVVFSPFHKFLYEKGNRIIVNLRTCGPMDFFGALLINLAIF